MDKEFYIIRHGETDLNKQGIIQGRGIDSDLNDTGRAQAAAFYAMYKDLTFDKVYTSALKRTHQTVKGFIDAGLHGKYIRKLMSLPGASGKVNKQMSMLLVLLRISLNNGRLVIMMPVLPVEKALMMLQRG
jgi:bisphosphoglycerate-dependent phosphoglycerate mutase